MPNMNIAFGGNTIVVPGSYYQDNVQQIFPVASQASLPLIYIGFAYNGTTNTAYNFVSPQDMLNFMRGGPASGYVSQLTNPSPSLNGANNITFIAVGSNVPATLTLDNASSGAITLTSAVSGVTSNLVQAEVVAGDQYASSTSNITLYDGYSNFTVTGNNLGVPLQVAYAGTATGSLSYSVSGTAGNAVSLTLTSPNSGESATINLGAGYYATTAQVVEYINGTGFWAASLVSDTGGQLPSQYLTPASGTLSPMTSGGDYQYAGLLAIPYDAWYWVNQFGSAVATAEVVSGASHTSSLALIPLTHFSGGSSTTPTNGAYASGFNAALNTPGWIVFADNNSLSVQLLGAQHAETASEAVNGLYRRFFTGSNVGDSVSTTTANAAALNSIETCYFYPGVKIVNTQTGQLQTFGGLTAAAMAAGIASANQVALPLTSKPLNAAGVEKNLTLSEINTLQIGGVCPIVLGGANGTTPIILSDFTTWQTDNNPLNVFTQQVACRWWTAYTLKNALQPFVGQIASPDTLVSVANAAKRALNSIIYTPGSNGVLASWDTSSLTVSYNGADQTVSVSAAATTVGQFRFITETVTVQLYSGTVTG